MGKKQKQIGPQPLDGCPSASAPALTPLRSVARAYPGCTFQKNLEDPRDWIDEWAECGPVTGKSSLRLRGGFFLTLVRRERKCRESNRGLVITTVPLELCGLTYFSMIHRR